MGRKLHWKLVFILAVISLGTLLVSPLRETSGQSTPPGEITRATASPSPAKSTTQPQAETTQSPARKRESVDEAQDEVIRIDSNLVMVPVSVTDASGRPVRNLSAADFQLEEEGVPQQITTLGEPGKTPVEITLLFDVSGSLHQRFQFEQEAAVRFLKTVLKPEDAVSLFSIGFSPEMVQPRTTSLEGVVAAVMKLEPTKMATAFFDAIVDAAHYLAKTAAAGSRRVLLVISDGEDNNSERYRLGDVLRELQRADCLFYAINPSGPSIHLNKVSLKGQEGMMAMASATGGAAFVLDQLEELDAVFQQIATELQTQYLLGYYSSNERADGHFRRISVRVPKQVGLRIRARQGYYAPKG